MKGDTFMQTKYKDIYTQIKQDIESGKLKRNDRLDDEITLCKKYNCSRMTIKKALDLLVQEGLLFRKRGLGSFVMEQSMHNQRILLSERELAGLSKSTRGKSIASKTLEFKFVFANSKIAEHLNMKENDPLYYIVRVRYIDNEPCVVEQTYMNPSLIPGINQDILNGSIYNYIENTLHLKIGSAKKITRACISNDVDHKYLQLEDEEPVLEIEQIAYLDNGIPFEYSISRHRYDKFEFTTYSLRM